MKTSITIATFLVAGAGAASASALVSPYQGSDTLFNVTTQAIAAAGLTPTTAYVGGGSGNGESAMMASPPIQVTAPMSRMLKNGSGICTSSKWTATNTGTTGPVNAQGIVIGLDAVDVLSSLQAGGAATCNGTADNAGTGLAYSSSANSLSSWKQVLALVYGGKDPVTGAVDCNQASRQALVKNWSNLMQNACANGTATCSDVKHTVVGVAGTAPLWHAFRRDDASGTSDVFASVLGLSPSTSASSNNGFGASPYCNALNWDVTTANTSCALGGTKQFVGPGGVLDPVVNDGTHRRPPPGTWGDSPDPTGPNSADVLPTSLQDNDPIRRPCLGGGTNNAARTGEEVCNIEGTLGLVLPIPASDFIPKENTNPQLVQYPVNNCSGAFIAAAAPKVFNCAPLRATKHNGECPNGDQLQGGQCIVPIDAANNTSQCVATKATVTAFAARNVGSADGRAYNVHMLNGVATDGAGAYVQQHIATASGTLSLDFVGGYGRIHQVESLVTTLKSCQLVDATDQIGCLTQSDPCSIGYAGDTGKTWGQRAPGGAVASNIDAVRVNQVAPTVTTVQLLGKTGEYPLSRKLYFSTLLGFSNAPAANVDEITLGKYEAVAANINPILTANGFFTLGPLSPMGTDTPFCEDFNQEGVCGSSVFATNDNACVRSPAGIPGESGADPTNNPTQSTVCGNGKVEAFEECDDGATNGATGDACSTACRFTN
jgi:cysteine-rich repeat protein